MTRREREILILLESALSVREIAERLTLAVSSIKWYVQQIYSKLGVNNRRQALRTRMGTPLPPYLQGEYEVYQAQLRLALPQEEMERLRNEGRGMTVEEAVNLTLSASS